MILQHKSRFVRHGFSLVELMVAGSLAIALFTAGALFFQNVTAQQRRLNTYSEILIGVPQAANFYGFADGYVDAYWAPSYGRVGMANMMREKFWGDVDKASAIYCLSRDGLNSIRPNAIPIPESVVGVTLDTPEMFRQHLASVIPASASVFTPYRGAAPGANGTVFLIERGDTLTELAVRAIYEIDIVPTITPAGSYVSVRRYRQGAMTDFYDVFYPAGAGAAFRPLFVAFERRARKSANEGNTVDRYKKAAEVPFFFMWWPDPAAPQLESPLNTGTYGADDPRAGYHQMGARTSFMFTVPLFPPF